MIDFEKAFSEFVDVSDGSAIRDIYKIIPYLTTEQISIISMLSYYIEKYDLTDIKEFIDKYLENMSRNRNLGLMSSLNVKSLLKAYTQDELIRGIKVTANTGGD